MEAAELPLIAKRTESEGNVVGKAAQAFNVPSDENDNYVEVTTMSVNIRPLHDRILAKRIEEQEQVRGGIIIPDTAKEKPLEAEVIAVGEGKVLDKGERIPLDVKVGDRILVGKYSGTEVKLQDVDYIILREEEVLGVIKR